MHLCAVCGGPVIVSPLHWLLWNHLRVSWKKRAMVMNQNPYSYRQCSLIHYPCSWVCKSFCSSENKKWSTLKTALPCKFNLSGFKGRLFLYLIDLTAFMYSAYVLSFLLKSLCWLSKESHHFHNHERSLHILNFASVAMEGFAFVGRDCKNLCSWITNLKVPISTLFFCFAFCLFVYYPKAAQV